MTETNAEPASAPAVPEKPKMRLTMIDDWRAEFHRLWTVRVSLFMFLLTGAAVALPAFSDVLNPWLFLGVCCAGFGLIGFLRLVKQVPKADVS